MAAYNPCVHIEIKKLTIEGREEPLDINFFGGNETWRLCYNEINKPIHVDFSINRSLGSVSDSCNLNIYNSPFYEALVTNFAAERKKLENTYMWRIYIYAWFGDDEGKINTDKPANINPCFVGDIDMNTGFEASAESVNDSVIRLSANGAGHLAQTGAYKKKYPVGTNYRQIVDDIMEVYICNYAGYGWYDNAGAKKWVVIDPEKKLEAKEVRVKPFVITNNPSHALNDICRTFDMVWGVNNLVPYIMDRSSRMFLPNEIPEINKPEVKKWFIEAGRGMIGMPVVSPNAASFKSTYFDELSLGGTCIVDFGGKGQQINTGESMWVRADSISIQGSNYRDLTMQVTGKFWDDGQRKVLRSGRYRNFSGRVAI